MQEAPHPNRLKTLLTDAGYTLRSAAQESNIPEPTLRKYAAGMLIIPRGERIKLAYLIGCEVRDLAPQRDSQKNTANKLGVRYHMSFEDWDRHFSFGGIKTTSLVLDGNGEEAYLPENIHTHYDPQPATFFEEVMAAKDIVQQEQEEKRRNGQPPQWNGEKYHLSKIVVSREPVREHMTLGLWFKPRDHFTGLATRKCLDNRKFREKYLDDNDWYTPIVGMSMSMGVDLTVVSSDGYAILTQRGPHQSVHQGMFHSSVSEAVSPAFDRSSTSQAPDLYRCASRGLAEELGLHEPAGFSSSDIMFLSFTVDAHYALYGLRGMVKVKKRAEDILQNWHAGVKDKMENKQMFAVPFTPEAVAAFVFSHEPWAGGLVCLYHSLVHEYGREEVDRVISNISKGDL